MMTRHENHRAAPAGVYLSLRPLDLRYVGASGEHIDGRQGARYVRVPTALSLSLAPIAGGVFVFAFPFVFAIAALIGLGHIVLSNLQDSARQHAFVAQSRFAPAGAYLQGHDDYDDDALSLADLRAEVDARRALER